VSQVDSFLAGNSWASKAWYRFGRTVVVVITRALTFTTVEGREHLPASGAFIVAPIHRSYVDTPIIACITRRRLRYLGKDTMWKRRWSAWLLSGLGGFPVTRGSADREALRRCIVVLDGGEPLVLFPEGERKSGPVVQPLFDGAVYVAAKSQVPIVPVGIGGSERVMPKGVRMVRPHKVHVVIGPPLPPPPLAGKRIQRDELAATSAALSGELQRLFDQAQRHVGLLESGREPVHQR
jgi:1-acyl-sn-glycerol-3-phosphate acyltransferase